MTFSFIDLFAGIGGTRMAFERLGGYCVFSSEIDKFARQTYEANFTWVEDYDITTCDISLIPNHDILVAGFPCQSFSNAGLKLGFDDIRGTMFSYVAQVLEEKMPAMFLLENVKGLLSHDKGRTFQIMRAVLKELGYHISFQLIDAKYWVPQHRERVYIVGARRPFNLYVPLREPHLKVGNILEDNVDEKYTLSDRAWTGMQAHRAKHESKGNGFGYGLVTRESSYTKTLLARYYKDGSEILVEQKGNPRRLTPRECARLMGFPEGFVIPVSDSQAYKQFGNSVVVPVVEEIAGQMLEML